MESNDSPEIPERGETSDIPGLPSGEMSKEEIPGSRCSMHGYILTYSRLKRENLCDLDFLQMGL